MNIFVTLYIILIICYFIFSFSLIGYLYLNYSKPYKPEKLKNYTKEIPSKLSPIELSILMNNKITPQVFTATIYYLIGSKALIKNIENKKIYLYRNLNFKGNLSHSQKYALKLLIETMGNGEKVSFEKIEKFCSNNAGATTFLLNYEIWKRMAAAEGGTKQFFEPKPNSSLVKWSCAIGIILFLINIIFGIHMLLGYLIILPAVFSVYYFKKIFKRTKKYNNQFYKWLEFSNYLMNIKELGHDKENNNFYLMYSIILDKLEYVEPHLLKSNDFINLNKYIKKCYTRAYFHGSRSI